MNELDDLLGDDPVDDGLDLLSELVAAVAWLRRGAMPDLTVWHAIDQALRLHTSMDSDCTTSDPLRGSITCFVSAVQLEPLDASIAVALRGWLDGTAALFNERTPWL